MNINDYKKVTDRLEPDERCRKEVLGMNKGENKIKQNINNEFEEKVSGVEVKRGNNAMKYISIAAAFVLVAGGIGTTGYLMHRNGSSQLTDVIEETASEASAEEMTEDESEIITEEEEKPIEYDYDLIANNLTDRYLEGVNILVNGDVDYDSNDSITFYTYDSHKDDWNKYGGERTFYRVTDERFKNCQDIYEYYKEPLASVIGVKGYEDYQYEMPENYEDAQNIEGRGSILSWLGGDISKFEVGSKVDISPDGEETRDNQAMSVNNALYVEYNGQLYVNDWSIEPHQIGRGKFIEKYNSDPKITDKSEDCIQVSRYCKVNYVDWDNFKYGEEKQFYIYLVNGEWKIGAVNIGVRPEYDAAVAIYYDSQGNTDYNDINFDCDEFMSRLELIDYNEETHISKVHVILHDMNGNDAAEITAEVNLDNNSDSYYKVISKDITRLK
ncbi:MAG: hypothetical protein K5898_08855 [Ruminococcus sp.]|uniref:hypothetical protein n=1 Tax=Ruminococcus sp. TaxID=41978 RepID=UPI0025F6A40E|nr:hypothetical protein [Ruminococcus sp.]MCR4795259.1 hypothetical protein [Ruminococcus sp.]